jgi:DNA-binding IclR family transcriptional regulator
MRDAAVLTADSDTADRAPYVIASALRTLQVLHAFALPPHRLGLAEVVAQLGLERNQAYRSLKTLEAAGFLVATDDARFEPGPAAAALATASARYLNASLVEIARPYLDRISSETRETVHLFARLGDRVVCVDRRESPENVRLVSVLGRSFALHAGAVPKAVLAHLSDRDRAANLARLGELPSYTARTARDAPALEAELALVRERGYAVSDEDFDAFARGVGAAILAPDGTPLGGLSVGGPSFRVDDTTLHRFADLVRTAAHDIARHLALAGRS